ncbi:hypothetical protein [Microvirga massiliensis]|uniref:hypothetical protein n=1 Tax=Microvirga massiliensis TaxID=1033741 RepID=UPI00062BBC5A|nr:hypothetical protein [Microvirga massiliensis]
MTAHGSFGLNEAFDPDTTRLLASAFESALGALNASDAEQFSAHSIRQILAKSIIDDALGGERDVAQLAERALAHLWAQSYPSEGSVPQTNRYSGVQATER